MKTLTITNGIKIVLLPFKELNTETMCICIRESGLLMDALHLGRLSKPCTKADLKDLSLPKTFAPVHAYVLSDKKIKQHDWVYRSDTNEVFKTDFVTDAYVSMPNLMGAEGVMKKYCTRIGSTTDRNLVRDIKVGGVGVVHKRVPMLSNEFMDRLCHEYNTQNNC